MKDKEIYRNNEMIKEMVEMQKALDESIYNGHGVEYNEERTYLALIDEIGELTHELKAEWCWWKKTVNPVDNSKVLEELVDVWHFALSIYYHSTGKSCYERITKLYLHNKNADKNLPKIIQSIIDTPLKTLILRHMIDLTNALNFTVEDVYEAYIKKNQINYERLKNNY